MVCGMSDEICICDHPKSAHIPVIVLSGPGNDPASVPIGTVDKCILCLCQRFEPQEQPNESEPEE